MSISYANELNLFAISSMDNLLVLLWHLTLASCERDVTSPVVLTQLESNADTSAYYHYQ